MSLMKKIKTALLDAKSGQKIDFEESEDRVAVIRVYLNRIKKLTGIKATSRVVDGKVVIFRI